MTSNNGPVLPPVAMTEFHAAGLLRAPMSLIYRTIFAGPYFGLMVGLIVIQQVIVASSVYFLANGAIELTEGDRSRATGLFFIYLTTLVLPYIPGLMAQYFWRIWRATMVRDFHRMVLDRYQHNPSSFSDTGAADQITAVYSNGVPTALNHAADYTYDFLQCLFNSTFGMIAVAYFVDMRLGLAYGLSLVICAIYTRYFYSRSAAASEGAERERIGLVSIAQRFWPNVILNNSLAYRTWTKRLFNQHEQNLSAVRRETYIRYVSNGFLSLATLLPVVLTCAYLAQVHLDNNAYLASLFVTIPRLFAVLSLVSLLMFMMFDFSQTYGRLKVVNELFDKQASVGEYDLTLISVIADGCERRLTSIEDFVDVCRQSAHVTIRGENGSGKTSLLLEAKRVLGDSAFYLPTTSMLDLPSKDDRGSTGQRKRQEIEATLSDVEPCILMLDEWDANLDGGNRRQIELLLDDGKSKGFRLVEIRHK